MSSAGKEVRTNAQIWVEYIDSLSWKKGELDLSSWNSFLRAGSLKVPEQDAAREVAARIEAAGVSIKTSKLESQIKLAYGRAVPQGTVKFEKKPKYVYEPTKLKKVADKLDLDITPEWLAKVSPLSVKNRSPAGFLQVLFKPRECVLVFDVFESQGHVWEHLGSQANLSVNCLQKGRQNVWFASNPMDGLTYWNPRQEKNSRRSEESVVDWRFCVLESDHAPKDLWLKTVAQLPIPIAAIYDSGGSSIHILVVINASSKAEWDRIVRCDLAQLMIPLGADLSALTAIRLTRLPNCMRGETGRLQRLLYLDPSPGYTPISVRFS